VKFLIDQSRGVKRKKNVLMILLEKKFPPDIRVEKEAKTLINTNYEIHLIARRNKNQIKKEILKGIYVNRFFCPQPLILIICRYLILFQLVRLSRKYHIDVLHVHDLPSALATCLTGKIIHKPVILDLHEDYTAMINYKLKRQKGIKKIILTIFSKLLEIEERIVLALSTKIIVVVEEEIGRLTKMGVPLEKIEVISNTADFDKLNAVNISYLSTEFKNKFVISYIGGFSLHRGLDTLIKAMPLILKKIHNAHLLLVGEGAIRNKLELLCRFLKIDKYVSFTGWVSFNKAMNYIKISDICTIPYNKTRQTNKSFPHKMSQYMYYKKPILVSDVTSLKRIIKEENCGIVFKAGDTNDLADKIIKIKNFKILEKLGSNGRMAAEKKYNWSLTSKKLIKLYNNI